MKNVIFWIVSALIYVLTIVLLSFKLRDIIKNPHKYKDEELVKQGDELIATKKYHIPFRSLSHQYAMVDALFIVVLTALDFGLIILLQNAFFIDGEKITLGVGLIGVLALMFLNVIVGLSIIPLAIKTPFFEVASRCAFNVESRSENYKKAYIFTLVLAVITIPFAAFGANTYAYYNDNGVTFSQYFDFGETTVAYEDIASVKVEIHHNNSGQVNVFHYYIITKDNKWLDVNDPNTTTYGFVENVYSIHKLIEEKGTCSIDVTPLNDVDEKYINEKLTAREQEIVRYIYGGFHRPRARAQ